MRFGIESDITWGFSQTRPPPEDQSKPLTLNTNINGSAEGANTQKKKKD